MRLAIDFEWHIEGGGFRCGSWYDGKTLYGTLHNNVLQFNSIDTLIGHNIIGDLRMLLQWGVVLPKHFTIEDSLIAARLQYPHAPTKELKPFAREFGFQWEDEHTTQDTAALLEYCGKDTYASWHVLEKLKAEMDPTQLALFVFHSRLELAMFACEVAGIKLDQRLLEEESLRRSTALGGLAKTLPEHILTNDNVFREWLRIHFTEEQLKVLPWTETKQLSVGVKGLNLLPKLKDKETRELFKSVRLGRELQDYYTLYVDRPKSLMSASGFLHPSYKHLVAKTHRRSTAPAIQNWPVEARKICVSRFPGGKIVSLDFKNLEARLFAWEAGCKRFLEALLEGGYPRIAEIAFGWERITKADPRYKVLKSLVLAVLYNMSVGRFKYGLRIDHNLEITWQDAQSYVDDFFTAFPEIHKERERRKRFVLQHGYAQSQVGARIPLPIIPSGLWPPEQAKWKQKHIDNQAVNFPTQNLASYVTGGAMLDVMDQLLTKYNVGIGQWLEYAHLGALGHDTPVLGVLPIAEIHDELVFDCKPKTVEWLSSAVRDCMVNAKTLKQLISTFDCPLDADISVGDTWT